jgi:hypothetical protein
VKQESKAAFALIAVKLLHTAIWLFFTVCILAIPVAGYHRQFLWAAIFAGLVLVECLVLAFNHGHCPLTDVAGRFTQQRRDNFDIYLPNWLARHNKMIFGTLYLAGTVFALGRWFLSPR